jgi:heme exporter protein CcmD
MNSVLAMGGYGLYVWTAYGITLVVFGMNLLISFRENSRIKKMIRQQLAKSP